MSALTPVCQEAPGTSKTEADCTKHTEVNWMAASDDQVALSWTCGHGLPNDVINVQRIDQNGGYVGARVSTGQYQPSSKNAVVWLPNTKEFMLAGTRLSGYCGGDNSITCETFGRSIPVNGSPGSTMVLRTHTPRTGGFFPVGNELAVTFGRRPVYPVELRSYKPNGTAGVLNNSSIWEVVPDEIVGLFTGAASLDLQQIFIMFRSTDTGLTLLRLNSGGTVVGSFDLDPEGRPMQQQGIIVGDWVSGLSFGRKVYTLYYHDIQTKIYLGVWNGANGDSLNQFGVDGMADSDAVMALSETDGVIYVLVHRPTDDVFLHRFDLDGNPVDSIWPDGSFMGTAKGIAIAAAPQGGAMIAFSDYAGGNVRSFRADCAP